MKNLNIPVGISDFERIRELNYYYVDKTGLIKTLLQGEMDQVTLITRPRRFGKTMAMNMVASFLDIRKDSKELFDGLEISKEKEICKNWMNQYPTLFLSLKDVDGTTFENAFNMLKFVISSLCSQNSYLETGENIRENEKDIFSRLRSQTASITDIKGSIVTIMNMMQSYYEKPVILLIDEYDVPIAKASNNGYYKEMLEVIKGMLSTALKDNSSLKFAVITGCLKIAKESIFTGTNNFVSDTISSTRYNEYYGFTQQDVDKLLADAEIEEKADLIKEWYDGYNFGEFEVYCPWDVMNYLRDLQNDLNARPVSYWKNTSDNAIIRSFIDYTGAAIRKKLEVLIAGGSICQKIEEDLTYDYLHSSEDNVWSILYLTGYLTKVGERDKDDQIELRIPNKEVKEIFESTVRKWFEDSARVTNRKDLFDAVWNKDADKVTKEISTLLRMTISYYDYREDFYHAFLAGIFAGAGYSVESNREHGEGRSDIVIYNDVTGQVAVFEAKYSRKLEDLEKDCQKALDQINTKMYAKEFEDAYEEVLCYGIAFYKKRCLVKSK
ncbi:AAA family ATPase [Anaerostipes hadrus]|uniref:AAA family ATPase n=1 Tax=Anaerostipes hadrus TaxID=649756 RepID=UPI001D05EEBC|nr:AAA family ATPase [Anaerostipes hadrus]MCB6744966.1 ATP-binding protein [Anaerostipes hadrus]